MNGVGIGTSVGLGTVIGLTLLVPGAPLGEYFATFTFYGIISGLIFETFRFVFQKAPAPTQRP